MAVNLTTTVKSMVREQQTKPIYKKPKVKVTNKGNVNFEFNSSF